MSESEKKHRLNISIAPDCGLGLPYIGQEETKAGVRWVTLGDNEETPLYKIVRPDYSFFFEQDRCL